ncbi:hypothetical protein ACFC09_30300 [Streptomyces sp. NPDC056161]|uniref:hypothetical protein n=1 Tax=Streptomyces sp. NPDC056161 TaxID=3345732 RepID=UPI0035DC66D7
MEGPERPDEAAPAAEAVESTALSLPGAPGLPDPADPAGSADPVGPVGPVGLTDPVDLADPVGPARPRRRGRTTALVAVAAVLGVVAGTCTGYLIQADREPTELPSLSQPVVKQAKGEVEPLSAAQDRRVKTDGDLRKLLIARPAGTRDGFLEGVDDGWLDQAAYSNWYKHPAAQFEILTDTQFRRAVGTSWRVGDTYEVEVVLAQYRQELDLAASEATGGDRYWAESQDGTRSWPVPGTGSGQAYVHDKPYRESGYVPVYSAEAHAWRGDISVEIFIHDTKPVSKEKILDLAERQMGKL